MDDWVGDILAIASIDFLLLLPFAARQWARRPHYRRVSHRKLRVASARGRPAAGSTASRNAPVAGSHTPTLRASAEARIGGAAVPTSSETPHPAPQPSRVAGAGLNPGTLTVGLASTGTFRAVADEGYPESRATAGTPSVSSPRPATQTAMPSVADSRSGLGLKQSATVTPPDVAVADSQLPAMAQIDWGTAGASGPETGAPAHVPMSQTIETAA